MVLFATHSFLRSPLNSCKREEFKLRRKPKGFLLPFSSDRNSDRKDEQGHAIRINLPWKGVGMGRI